MKQQFTKTLLFILFITGVYAYAGNGVKPQGFRAETKNAISFTENKGQISDQNYVPRTDVLYSGITGNMAFHLRDNGISYQLSRVDSWEKTTLPGQKSKVKQPALSTIYRLDIDWLNADKNAVRVTDKALPGFNNYYLAACPNGALNVKAYEGVTYKNIYPGIDLHYYESKGQLKYDYLVAAGAGYRQIQLSVSGAKNISLNAKGELIIKTPLGDIAEGAPLVFQNGKTLTSHWVISKNVLSFHIEDLNESDPFVIDPVVRTWGTYYGVNVNDGVYGCSTDAAGNVYFSGSVPASGNIATAGSHQVTYGGSFDGYLAKFTSAGARIWSTYYGGDGGDSGYSCMTDASSNIYMIGVTSSTSAISTPGSHQPVKGVGDDAFIVKFNSGGVRQWGSYYGGPTNETGFDCAVDPAGNVFMAGHTYSNTGTTISTPGSHQPAYGGSGPNYGDGFLVKFNPAGVRQWGTFYGSTGEEVGYSCATDNLGNIYLAGYTTYSTTGTAIATVGSHQASFGGIQDAYLVKFDPAGVRLWSTLYGGSNYDIAYGVTVDASNNVYISGFSSTPTSTAIATASAHQPTLGGLGDGFLAKFTPAGVRLWGSYYGGNDYDYAYNCITDAGGNIYISGETSSTVNMATAGSHQTVFGAAVANSRDAFIAKFDPAGARQWGTYYGGVNDDFSYFNSSCIDLTGNIYLAGSAASNSSTFIAVPGSFQPTHAGGSYDGFIVQFSECPPSAPVLVPAGSSQFICTNASATLQAAGSGTINWYATATSTTVLASGQTFVTPTLSTGTYTYYTEAVTCTTSALRTAVTVTVEGLPVVTVNGATICSGQSFTLSPSGAATYTYSGGAAIVSPVTNASYSITGISAAGCVSAAQAVANITVQASPTLAVNSASVCSGNSVVITPTGAVTYTISGGSFTVTPPATTSYSVTGTGTNGCISAAAVSNITVYATPTLSVNNPTICSGVSVTITPSGAATYTTIGGTIPPSNNSTYSVTGTSTAGCVSATKVVTLTVNVTPTITVNSATICSGNSVVITPTGAVTYSITGGTYTVTPNNTTSYSVTGVSTEGCASFNTAVASVSVNITPTVLVNSATVCSGHSVVITPTGAATYTISGNAYTVTPLATTLYSVSGTAANGCVSFNTAIATVSVNITPTINVNSGYICSGNSFTIVPGGAATYTISGNAFTVTPPTGNYFYPITGTAANGCVSSNTAVSVLVVYATPTITVNSEHICSGSSATITPGGADTYTITGNLFTVTPSVNTTYSVTGTSTAGCISSAAGVSTITVNSGPTLTVTSSTSTLCAGESGVLFVNGTAEFYEANGSPLTSSISITPTATTIYTVITEDLSICTTTVYFTQYVEPCLGINNFAVAQSQLRVYPNPNSGNFIIEAAENTALIITNALGQVVYTGKTKSPETTISLGEIASGVYFIKAVNGTTQTIKLIKE